MAKGVVAPAAVTDVASWARKQRGLLDQEREAERAEIADSLAQLSAAECQLKGLSVLSLSVKEVTAGLFGRCIVSVGDTKNRPLASHRFSSGDEVTLRSTKGAANGSVVSITGVVGKVTDERIDIISDDDKGEAELLKAPLRLDVLASEATHKKLVQGLANLEGRSGGVADRVVSVLFGQLPPSLVVDSGAAAAAAARAVDASAFFNPGLNDSQREAIAFALATDDVALIHGPPGTGKTTTVVELVLQAVARGWRVLVAAPSNVAVDNVLEKIVESQDAAAAAAGGVGAGKKGARPRALPVRLGHPARLLPAVLRYSLDALLRGHEGTALVDDAKAEMRSIRSQLARAGRGGGGGDKRALRAQLGELRREVRAREEGVVASVLRERTVVLATCVGAATRVLRDAQFDLVVIDEAAQALEVACWIPALKGRRLVLAGDHRQLAPTVKSNAAARDGLGVTLFDRLLAAHGDGVARMLDVQYRMHADICGWASEAMYDGRLRAHDSAAARTLPALPHARAAGDMTAAPLLLLDTAGCEGMREEAVAGGSVRNAGEAAVAAAHVRALVAAGVRPREIAVITPYNAQVDLLKGMLRPEHPGIEVRSVDGFQGGEREAVVLSLVRSNEKGTVGFLADDRRLNVAVTRARRHCAIVCDTETVSRHDFIAQLAQYFEQHGEYRSALELVPDAATHAQADAATVVAAAAAVATGAPQATIESAGAAGAGASQGNGTAHSGSQPHGERTAAASAARPAKAGGAASCPPKGAAGAPGSSGSAKSRSAAFDASTGARAQPLLPPAPPVPQHIALAESFSAYQSSGNGGRAGDILHLSAQLSAKQRAEVHEAAERLGLGHASEGTGAARHVVLTREPQGGGAAARASAAREAERAAALPAEVAVPGVDAAEVESLLRRMETGGGLHALSGSDGSDGDSGGEAEAGGAAGAGGGGDGGNALLAELAAGRQARAAAAAAAERASGQQQPVAQRKAGGKGKKGGRKTAANKAPAQQPQRQESAAAAAGDSGDDDDMAFLEAEIKRNRRGEPCYANVLRMTTGEFRARNPDWDPNSKSSISKQKRQVLAHELGKKIDDATKQRTAQLKSKKK